MSTAAEILAELATKLGGPVRDRLRTSEDGATIVDALRMASDEHAIVVLCDVLGFRHEAAAVDELVRRLEHPASKVRSSAADALAKIGDPRAGAALMARFGLPEPELGVRRMIVAALGAVRYRPAIPMLIECVAHPDESQRGGAAWSLGFMRAQEALRALEAALRKEQMRYPAERIRAAIDEIRAAR